MPELLFASVDCGGTQTRVAILDNDMRIAGIRYGETNPSDYESTVQGIADTMGELTATVDGEIVAGSIAVAAEVDNEGYLRRAGGLTPWIGRRIGFDVASAAGLGPDSVGAMGDMEAAAKSQLEINRINRRSTSGVIMTLSSGWGGAKYTSQGRIEADEPGHQYLREGGICPCGESGHSEAFIAGIGAQINHGMPMKQLLREPGAADRFVDDLAASLIRMSERHRKGGFEAEEFRFMGGVAANQPLLMWRASELLRHYLGSRMPAWESVTMGDQAGLHGTFIDAKHRAAVA